MHVHAALRSLMQPDAATCTSFSIFQNSKHWPISWHTPHACSTSLDTNKPCSRPNPEMHVVLQASAVHRRLLEVRWEPYSSQTPQINFQPCIFQIGYATVMHTSKIPFPSRTADYRPAWTSPVAPVSPPEQVRALGKFPPSRLQSLRRL